MGLDWDADVDANVVGRGGEVVGRGRVVGGCFRVSSTVCGVSQKQRRDRG